MSIAAKNNISQLAAVRTLFCFFFLKQHKRHELLSNK